MRDKFLQQLHARGERIGAVILAGGLARRMGGQDKGLLPLAGRSMSAWVLDSVQPQVDLVVLNANRNAAAYAQLGVPVIADRHTGHIGPLAGLSAAIAALDTDYIFMCPCDSPFVADCIVGRLGMSCLQQAVDVAVAHDGEREQPVFCVVHRRTADSLREFLDAGERKIDRWYAGQRTQRVDCRDLAGSFRNINTEDERAAAEQELSA